MSQYTSYYLYQKYQSIDGGTPTPVSPAIYSIDADGTMPRVVKSENDPNCGYVPPVVEPIYEWQTASGEYVCDECEQAKAIIHTSASTIFISGGGEVTRAEVSGYSTAATDVVLTNDATAIGNGAFSGFTRIEFVRIPNTVLTIGERAFMGCSAMTECQIPYGTTTIGNSVFYNCTSLMYIDIPSTVTSIESYAFYNCLNFRYVSIPNSITEIPSRCFYNCNGLSDIELPDSITSIGQYAFAECSGIYSITVYATTPPTLGTNAFQNTNSNLKIYVPAESVNAYKSAWSTYASIIYPIQ